MLQASEIFHILSFAKEQPYVSFLCSNSDIETEAKYYHTFDWLLAFGESAIFPTKQSELPKLSNEWLFGHISYDWKNKVEALTSTNEVIWDFPDAAFFKPTFLVISKNGQLEFKLNSEFNTSFRTHLENYSPTSLNHPAVTFQSKWSKAEYIEAVESVKNYIRDGAFYEFNLCQPFTTTDSIDAELYFSILNEKSPMPFAAYYKLGSKYVLSASPERFLKKSGNSLLAQPIKGTRKRNKSNPEIDQQLKVELEQSEKERAENVMIVDLMRNDLARISEVGSVHVSELCKVYSFEQVHQMISSVESRIEPQTSFSDIIQATFPMGSMTGAPKIRMMEVAEEIECFKRSIYSGSIGYLTADGDFDFNVVIRSLLIDQDSKKAGFAVGGAITWLSDPEAEYEECLIKAKAFL